MFHFRHENPREDWENGGSATETKMETWGNIDADGAMMAGLWLCTSTGVLHEGKAGLGRMSVVRSFTVAGRHFGVIPSTRQLSG